MFSRLLAFVIRALDSRTTCPFTVRDIIETTATTLSEALESHDPDDEVVQRAIHELARAVFDYACPNPADAAVSPLVVATYLFCIRTGTSQFHRPASTTFYTAALSWVGRNIALVEILHRHACAQGKTDVWTSALEVFPSIKNATPSAWSHMRE